MTLTMTDAELRTVEEIKKLLKHSSKIVFRRENRSEAYAWIEKTLMRLKYFKLKRPEKGAVRSYLKLITGYSRAQVTRLIELFFNTDHVRIAKYKRHTFPRKYNDGDIQLLAKTDELHEFPNGNMLKIILGRMAAKDPVYATIRKVSVGHIYNLRKKPAYRRTTLRFEKTRPTKIAIGLREKPQPNGKPGFIRVDSVHQGDKGTVKGLYHINSVDEVTQFEIIGAVETLTEEHMLPMLKRLIEEYPFVILGFHADNGSEYINHEVAKLLNKLLIKLTKSRPRHSNDNGLPESKNGAVIRKWFGYLFIDSSHADKVNDFYFNWFNRYLNYHRPCAFAKISVDHKGKVSKKYPLDGYRTPYEKLRALPKAAKYLKKSLSFRQLDLFAAAYTDNQIATIIQTKRKELFDQIFNKKSSP
jgi:transposase InsO family protein